LADALTLLVGWILLATWALIALAHRHPAGPLLLLAGGIELLTLFALVPDALAAPSPLPSRRVYGPWHADDTGSDAPVRHDVPARPVPKWSWLRRDA
jgi:hypothetical protein